VGKQKIVDEGPLPPHPTEGVKLNMETVDDVILEHAVNFMKEAKKEDKPFFVWLNPTRMHVFTHLAPKYEKLRTPENGWSLQEAGMAQFDDIIGGSPAQVDAGEIIDPRHILLVRQERKSLHLVHPCQRCPSWQD
jgi:hypothetical protein